MIQALGRIQPGIRRPVGCKPRFGGGYLSNVASNVIAHLDGEFMWQHQGSPTARQLRQHLLTGLAVLGRRNPLVLDAVLEQFTEHFPRTRLADGQPSLTREGLEVAVMKRDTQLAAKPDADLMTEVVRSVQTMACQRIAGARAVENALMIMEDVISDTASRLGGDN